MASEQRRVSARGVELAVSIDGEAGRPWVTCLNSLATTRAMWDPQVPALTRTHRVLRIDARGHGESSAPPPPYALADFVADVVAIWDAVGVDRSAVIGLSLGGMTGFGLALDHRPRVTRLVAADCRSDAPEFFVSMWGQRKGVLAEKGLEGIADMTVPTWLTEATRNARPDLADKVRGMILATAVDGYLGSAAALERLDYKRRLPEIAVPTLLVVGDKDGVHPKEMREMAALIPGSAFEEIADAAHLANLDQPERFNAVVTAFLNQ